MQQRFPVLRFLAMRTALLLVVVAILWALGLHGAPGLLLALILSSIISLFVLNRQRDAVSGSLDSRVSKFRRRINEAASAEDE